MKKLTDCAENSYEIQMLETAMFFASRRRIASTYWQDQPKANPTGVTQHNINL